MEFKKACSQQIRNNPFILSANKVLNYIRLICDTRGKRAITMSFINRSALKLEHTV